MTFNGLMLINSAKFQYVRIDNQYIFYIYSHISNKIFKLR